VPDPVFANSRLAEVYDPLDPDRSDLDAYAAMIDEFGVRSVLDVGCGTGTFACMLARRGIEVVGVDPAAASLDVARGKPGADRVRWILGDATTLPTFQVDIAFMTGNVAQVFLTDESWMATLHGVREAVAPNGRFVFETRDPSCKGWQEWTRDKTFVRADLPRIGVVESWSDVTDVSLPFVTFRSETTLASDGKMIASQSTLRFRNRDEVAESLEASGFHIDDVRDAPDRPGREFVFITSVAD
jgi:ubiquinone/menaquinone biosynthesis C-methylase UbiE